MPDFISPNTGNYQIPKGEVYFTPEGADPVTGRRHMGNVPEATFLPEVEKLDHFSSMAGIRKKDFSATLSVTGTLTLTLEEISEENLKIALLGGDSEDNTDGENQFYIGEVESVTGKVEIVGTNDVGPKWTYEFPSVTFAPSDAVSFIGEEFSGLQVEGDVLAISAGGRTYFGIATLQGSTTA